MAMCTVHLVTFSLCSIDNSVYFTVYVFDYHYSKISVGTRCLVKQDDELWHEANIW